MGTTRPTTPRTSSTTNQVSRYTVSWLTTGGECAVRLAGTGRVGRSATLRESATGGVLGTHRNEAARQRVAIEGVTPEIDAGRFAVKRIIGDTLVVDADIFADGHVQLSSRLLYRREGDAAWHETPMRPLGNDHWRGEFTLTTAGRYEYTIEAWVDELLSWRHDFGRRVDAGQDVGVELLVGAALIDRAAARAKGEDAAQLAAWAGRLRTADSLTHAPVALDAELGQLALRYPDHRLATRYARTLGVIVDRPRARFSAWYELFPRSCAAEPGRHGTLRDCERWLPYIAGMGFDVLYLPPIHPIGRTFRKGRNNALTSEPDDVGSPWAIGAAEGGHDAVHPDLGTLDDVRQLVRSAEATGIEVALDLAFQCSPDHPYATEHPEWFRTRPDGTIQYAENPPKKYQDIYPFDFDSADWEGLWAELKRVTLHWVDVGIRIFRVDNPHTKSFPFWEWLIAEVKAAQPDVLFLAEAFTRPRVMERLAKLGFTQSYTYFTWRNTKEELENYFTTLRRYPVREYFRPNLWPNTPDILSEYLQAGDRSAFMVRATLAATLGASYGIYGPAFELCENTPREPGSEEYLHSEKYEIKQRDLNAAWSLKDLLTRLNRIRRETPALQDDRHLQFHATDNPLLICYSKSTDDRSSVVLVVVNLDVAHVQAGWVILDLAALGVEGGESYQVEDALGGSRFLWQGPRNFVQLAPGETPAHILRLRRRIRTERDFDYYM
jgi:starch synthase (maltosyl-transferring)